MIAFTTPGPIDLAAVQTFGLSSKNESQIGRFGTGLKYATAIVLRLGGRIRIEQATGEVYNFDCEPAMFRNKPVAYVTMNGERLAFTTDLGRDWKPWMAFREFYANTLDEGGTFERLFEAPSAPAPAGHTRILIDCIEFDAVHDNFEEFFIDPDERPLWTGGGIEIYSGQSSQIFYRGFAVMHIEAPTLFRYNITDSVALTEDRTASSAFAVFRIIETALAQCSDEDILTKIIGAENGFEQGFDYPLHIDCSAAFCGVVKKLGQDANPSAQLAVAHTEHRNAKQSADVYEAAENPTSNNLMQALAHLRLLGADLSGFKVAYLPIPGGADGDVNSFHKRIIINDSYRDDFEGTLKHLLTAYMKCAPNFAHTRLMQLASELGKKLEAPAK